jgi:hypothetical protein
MESFSYRPETLADRQAMSWDSSPLPPRRNRRWDPRYPYPLQSEGPHVAWTHLGAIMRVLLAGQILSPDSEWNSCTEKNLVSCFSNVLSLLSVTSLLKTSGPERSHIN